jgi:aminoglycoside phosphotransferase (APT) family kinase protein
MDTEYILKLAKKVNPKSQKDIISKLSGGFSSQAYKVNIPAEPFVLLVQRDGAVSESNYGHAYVVLTLLSKHGIGHSPKALWLQEDHKALALSFEDGIASEAFNFHDSNIDTEQLAIDIIDNLLEAAVIDWSEYEQLAAELNVEVLPPQTPQDSARKYGTEWLEIVKKACPDPEIVAWLEPRVRRSVALAEKLGDNPPTFGHGDPSNPNILIRGDGSFTLIDWDSARFDTSGPEFYIAYTTHLTDFMKPYRQALTEHVAGKLKIPVPELRRRVEDFRHYSEVFDVNWAAMMMAKVSLGEAEGSVDHFRAIALKRIKIYEESFES